MLVSNAHIQHVDPLHCVSIVAQGIHTRKHDPKLSSTHPKTCFDKKYIKIDTHAYHTEYYLSMNHIKFTYNIHNCSIDMFKHLYPATISFTSENVKKNEASTFESPNLLPSHFNSTGVSYMKYRLLIS